MMHKAWCCLEEVPYCFSRSSVKFQGHTALKIIEFDPDWAFPDCNSSLISSMATKWCSKLEVVLKRCPIVFQGHTSNSKVTGLKNRWFWPKLAGRFRTVSSVWISWWIWNDTQIKAWCSIEDVPYYFSGSSIKFQGHTGEKSMMWIQFE